MQKTNVNDKELTQALQFEKAGQLEQAEQLTRRLAAGFRAEGQQEEHRLALALLCRILIARNEFMEAELHLLELISLLKKSGAGEHELAGAYDDLARSTNNRKRFSTTVWAIQESIKVKKAAFGEISRQVADSLNMLAGVFLVQGLYNDAEDNARRAFNIYSSALGVDRAESIIALSRLASAEAGAGKSAEAQRHFSAAGKALNTPMGSSKQARVEWLERYASFLRVTGKQQKAIELESELFQLSSQLNGWQMI